MDFNELFKMGADLIQNNRLMIIHTSLDTNSISEALNKLLGGENGSIDLSSMFSKLSEGNLGETIQFMVWKW